ncbi:dTMP kinase [Rubritalea squalenifaciens]|uniref:dTMP kinase n=1 Tax=Rubritalea squalenifaciens TaxID=407226 RepID=UPI00135634DA|nr:hypothetical protein [Rubritalea squalenifaciens]
MFAVCSALKQEGLSYVFLRGFEGLPQELENDADLLFSTGERGKAIKLVNVALSQLGWKEVQQLEFSPISVTYALGEEIGSVKLVIDYFEHIEWHYLPYMRSGSVLEHAVIVDGLSVPGTADRCFMNVVNRLLYSSEVREKHRSLYEALESSKERERFASLSHASFGKDVAAQFIQLVEQGHWDDLEGRADSFRRAVKSQAWRHRFADSFSGLWRYWRRVLKRMISPPGVFIVFEGADGVGKSSVIRKAMTALPEVLCVKEPVMFHWKPRRKAFGNSLEPNSAVDPRSSEKRGKLLSLCYLAYHWLGFWAGWLTGIYPRLIRNQLVVGDRYIYDMYFDPERFRLDVPEWVLDLLVKCLPRPHLLISLLGSPEIIRARKQELSLEEISHYQDKLEEFGRGKRWCLTLDANASLEEVVQELVSKVREATVK